MLVWNVPIVAVNDAASPPCNAVKAVASARLELMQGPLGIEDILIRASWFDADGEDRDGESSKITGIQLETVYVIEE